MKNLLENDIRKPRTKEKILSLRTLTDIISSVKINDDSGSERNNFYQNKK